MALVTRSLAAAMDAKSALISVDALTSLVAGMFCLVDGEFMGPVPSPVPTVTQFQMPRGQFGTGAVTHVSSAPAIFGLPTDFADPPPAVGSAYNNPLPTFQSYAASGAITPAAGKSITVVELIGTGALAMTLAAPTADQDGAQVFVYGNGKAAHTLTPSGQVGAGGAGYAKYTFAAGAQNCVALMAANGIWNPYFSLTGGTATNITATISA